MPEYRIVINSGCPRIEGSRIGVYDVMDYWPDKGYSIEQIAELFGLVPDQVRAAIQYIAEHRAEVEATYRKILERDARGNPPEVQSLLDRIHAEGKLRRAALHQLHARNGQAQT